MDAKDPMPGLRPGSHTGSQPAVSPTAFGAAGGSRLQTAGIPAAARQANGVLFSRQLAALRPAESGSGAAAATAPLPPAEVVAQRGDALTSLVRARWVALGGA
ncbi:MAG: hypothetical protein ACKOCU_01685, partial [Betaproteobacteria bacterium]